MIFAVRSPQRAAAQSGTVTYTHTLVLDIDLPPEMDQFMEQFKDMIPESITNSYGAGFQRNPEQYASHRGQGERRKEICDKEAQVQTGQWK